MSNPVAVEIDRGFVRLEEGLVHYRFRTGSGQGLPLYMVHAGPGSSRSLEPLMGELANRRLVAPDTLGFGDSATPGPEDPDLAYFADAAARVMDALQIERCDFYGSHTGAHIGCELAIRHPDRIRRVVLDGITVFSPEMREELLTHYAPAKQPDEYGGHLLWAWQFMRDQSIHFPHYRRVPEARTRFEVWPPDLLHELVLDVLKALRTYDKGYKAVFRHDVAARLPLVQHPALAIAQAHDPLVEYVEQAGALLPDAAAHVVPAEQGVQGLAQAIDKFLG